MGTFKALFGAVRFNSAASSGEVLSQGSISISTDGDGLLQGSSNTITANSVSMDATRASIELSGSDGLEFTVGDALSFESDGLDDNSDFGIAIEAKSTGPFEFIVGNSVEILSAGVFFDGETIDVDNANSV